MYFARLASVSALEMLEPGQAISEKTVSAVCQAGEFFIVYEDAPLVRNDLPGDHVEAGGLTGTVGAEEADDLALVYFHRHTFHNGAHAVFLYQIFAAEFHLLN